MSPALLLRPSLFSVVPADIPDEIDGQQNDRGHNGDDVNSYFHRKNLPTARSCISPGQRYHSTGGGRNKAQIMNRV